MRFACSFGWSVSASWHLDFFDEYVCCRGREKKWKKGDIEWNVLITWENFCAAAESEPALTFGIVLAAATSGEFLSCDDTEDFLGLVMRLDIGQSR